MNNSNGRKIKGMIQDVDTWPTFDEGVLQGDILEKYLSRKHAVQLYLEGISEKNIKEETGFKRAYLYRLITERCLAIHQDGNIQGWRGLIPNINIKEYKRQNAIHVDSFGYGAAGALGYILDCHPELKIKFDQKILKTRKSNGLSATKVPRKANYRWFLDELRKLKYEEKGKWPFNTELMGYVSINKYMDKIILSNPQVALKVLTNPYAEKKLKASDGVDRPKLSIYQRVEMDSHKIDGRFCILIPQIDGGYSPKIIYRLWVTVIVEVVSRAVLGYYLSLGKEVNKEDILRTIKMALSIWKPKSNLISNIKYLSEAGFPSSMSSEFAGVCWDETNVDGALAERCATIEKYLHDVVHSSLASPISGFLSRRSLDDRPYVEAFFRNLSKGAFHKLSNTTGNKPQDIKGRKPEEIAINSQFQLEYVEELLDVIIANYNITPHSGLGYRSPLEYLKFLSTRSNLSLRYADSELVNSTLSYKKKCTVLGNIEQGRKPYINFARARYTNEILSQRFDLIGKEVWVTNHIEDDARLVQCSTINGQSLDILRAAPPWHKLPHSIRVRLAICSLINKKKILTTQNQDAIEAFLDFCEAHKNHKLPIHPSYLELRRILSQNRENILEENFIQPSSTFDFKKSQVTASKASESGGNDTLPPRRMAVTRG